MGPGGTSLGVLRLCGAAAVPGAPGRRRLDV